MLNKFIGIGYLGADPEPLNIGVKLSLATEVFDGRQKKTIWLKVFVFGKSAENCINHKKKGDRIAVEGRVDVSKTGKTIIITDDVTFL